MSFEPAVVMDGEIGDEDNELMCVGSDESRPTRNSRSAGWRSALRRWFQRQDDAQRKEHAVVLSFYDELDS